MEKSPLVEAQENFLAKVEERVTQSTTRSLADAIGMTTYDQIEAPIDMPPYPRAIVEGFLVFCDDTNSASEEAPTEFKIVGKVKPGDEQCAAWQSGEAVEVVTGAITPESGVAVVRPWDAERKGDTFSITRPFKPGFFIEEQGCDVRAGQVVVEQGVVLDAFDLGQLAGMGVTEVSVATPPKVAIFSSGDEVVPHTEALKPGWIRDGNSVMLNAAVNEAGGEACFAGIVKDDFDHFVALVKKALSENDMILISGGTAVGGRNFVSDLIGEVGELVLDGVPMRSGRPLIMGCADNKPIVCVAGHPPEALRGFRLFGVPAIERLLGQGLIIPDDVI